MHIRNEFMFGCMYTFQIELSQHKFGTHQHRSSAAKHGTPSNITSQPIGDRRGYAGLQNRLHPFVAPCQYPQGTGKYCGTI